MDSKNALEIPPNVEGDPNAIEIARIWAAYGRQQVHIRTDLWSDAGNWGIMLADFAKHIANAYEEDGRGDYFEVLSRIREIFDAEWNAPTDIPTGKLTPETDEPAA